jgi:hypothetical protein
VAAGPGADPGQGSADPGQGSADPATGKTAPLAKGAFLAGAAGEGVGFGVPIVRVEDGWWFPAPESPLVLEPDGRGWTRTYDLALHEVDGPDGRFLRFERGESRGRVAVTYRARPGALAVQVRVQQAPAGLQQIVLLNEESAAFDDYADTGGGRRGEAVGSWSRVTGDWARFRSAALGLEWAVPAPPPGGRFFAAREAREPVLDFSGLEWVLGPEVRSVDYEIQVRRAR